MAGQMFELIDHIKRLTRERQVSQARSAAAARVKELEALGVDLPALPTSLESIVEKFGQELHAATSLVATKVAELTRAADAFEEDMAKLTSEIERAAAAAELEVQARSTAEKAVALHGKQAKAALEETVAEQERILWQQTQYMRDV